MDEINTAADGHRHTPTGTIDNIISRQLQIMQLQLEAMREESAGINSQAQASATENTSAAPTDPSAEATAVVEEATPRQQVPPIAATRSPPEKTGENLTRAQQHWIANLLAAYQEKFAGSQRFFLENRLFFTDPCRGPEWNEKVFPIVADKSKGSKIRDIDGNELIDTCSGFGSIFFGHSPEFITDAVKNQLDRGTGTTPRTPLAGAVARLFCELTGHERCSFAGTGSEAVAGAVRLARTVTGRDKIVMFEGGFHGVFDENAAPEEARRTPGNIFILPWGSSESLQIIKEMGMELAAVLMEPVQSRHPHYPDPGYLKEIRKITAESGSAMILDEVVTGFRIHPKGVRKMSGIDCDLAIYGKIAGGGYPLGIIGGKARYIDILDGGYPDSSSAKSNEALSAGDFEHHPVALAAAKAVLERIKSDDGKLYKKLEENTAKMAGEAKGFIEQLDCEVKFEYFTSIFYLAAPENGFCWRHLLFLLMMLEGVHTQQYRPNFLTAAHSSEDIAAILSAFKRALSQLVAQGLIDGDMVAAKKFLSDRPAIPAGARLGKNARGEPAYFVEDPKQQGKYIEVGKP